MRKSVLAVSSLGILLVLADGEHARMFVVASDAPEYPTKKVIELGDTLKLPAGKRITVMLPDGTTRELTSANNGAVAVLLQPVKVASWWNDLIDIARSGGGSSRPGSVRSVTVRPTVFAVDGQTGANVRLCLEPPVQPVVTRDRTEGSLTVTILAEASGKRATADFAAGQEKLTWPSDLAVADGQSYRVTPTNAAPMQVEVRVVPSGLKGEAQVRTLGAAGCTRQAAAVLQSLAK